MSELTVTKESFEQSVLKSDLPVLLDFWAPWCGPCRAVAPVVAQVAQELEGKAVIGKVNVDEQPELAAKFGVMNIPTLIVFRGGEPAVRKIGLQSKQALLDMLK